MNFLSNLKLTLLLIILFPTVNYAQQVTVSQKVKTIYYYTFQTENISTIDNVLTQIKDLTGVTETKYEYKSEKNAGQLIVVVEEKKRTTESDILFQPTDLKRILSENGYTPNQLTTEVLNK